MAVYTEIGDEELRAFTALYDIGEVLSCKGIAEGVENSNFLLTTERSNFILTLYEKRVARGDLPFFIALMDHLAHQGVPSPTPVRRATARRHWPGTCPRPSIPRQGAGSAPAVPSPNRSAQTKSPRCVPSAPTTSWPVTSPWPVRRTWPNRPVPRPR